MTCPAVAAEDGVVRSLLLAVDCQSREFAQGGYLALSAPGSPFQAWLTAALVIYVAVLGYRMLFGVGETKFSDLPLTGLKIGAILALVTSWPLFQTLVFDVASKAPIELARIVTAPSAAQSSLAGDPIGALELAHDQLALAAQAFGKAAGPVANAYAGGNAAAASALWRAGDMLFMSTAGAFAVSLVAVGVLTAIGPVFIALFLFRATRGLFAGWVRALAVATFAPLAGWLATSLMLMVLEPNLVALAKARLEGRLEVDIAMTTAAVVFVFSLVQMGLLAAGVLIGIGFRLPRRSRAAPAAAPAFVVQTQAATEPASRVEYLANVLRRTTPSADAAVPDRTVVTASHLRTAAYPAADGRLVQVARRPETRLRESFAGGPAT